MKGRLCPFIVDYGVSSLAKKIVAFLAKFHLIDMFGISGTICSFLPLKKN